MPTHPGSVADPAFYSISKLAKKLHIRPERVRLAIARGELKTRRLPDRKRAVILTEDAHEWWTSLPLANSADGITPQTASCSPRPIGVRRSRRHESTG
jgi:hypothetical protein